MIDTNNYVIHSLHQIKMEVSTLTLAELNQLMRYVNFILGLVVIAAYILCKFFYAHYFFGILHHKLLVYRECRKLGIPKRGLKHDLSKFHPAEYFAYARYWVLSFIKDDKNHPVSIKYEIAKDRHQKGNSHHWEYWVDDCDVAQPMDDESILEMVADWRAMSARHAGALGEVDYYKAKGSRINLHPETRAKLEQIIGYY